MKLIKLILVILWMLVIFFFSNTNSDSSTNQSRGFVYTQIHTINNLFNNKISEEKINSIIDMVELPVRKLAHVFLYFILAILITLFLESYNLNYKKLFLYSIMFCFIYSISDEIHQQFVPGRSGNIIDVIVDFFGIYIGVFVASRNLYKRQVNL